MSRFLAGLRGYVTWVVFGEYPCVVCGGRPFTPGAIRADVCETHYRERLRAGLMARD